MAESQSRYSIMEEFNKKKINARKRLADLAKEEKQEEMKHTQLLQQLNNQLTNENNNYKVNHQNWVTNQKLEITLRKQELEQEITTMQAEIEDANKTYEQEHKDVAAKIQNKIDDTKRDYDKYKTLRKLDKEAIEAELKEIDEAIKSLKDISVAQSA